MKIVTLKEFERGLDRRKAERGYVGNDFVRPNSGVARTPEKRALLREMERVARVAGRKPKFTANY